MPPFQTNDIPANADLRKDGIEALEKYQRGLQPKQAIFDFEGFRFFMLDTRGERLHRKIGAGLGNATLFKTGVGTTMDQLTTWLGTGNGPKFIASPSMFLPRHRRANQRDRSLGPDNLTAGTAIRTACAMSWASSQTVRSSMSCSCRATNTEVVSRPRN